MTELSVVPLERNPAVGVIRILAILGAVLLLVGSLLQLVYVLSRSGDSPVTLLQGLAHTFYADEELGLWSWFNALLFSLLAVAFLLRAGLHRVIGRPVVPLLVLGAAALYLSADETAALHEKLRVGARALHLQTGTYDWLVLGVPVAIVAAIALFLIARRIDGAFRRRLVVAAIVYVLGAACLEFVGGVLAKTPGLGALSAPYILEVTVEEGLEAAGILMAIWAVVRDLRIRSGPHGVEVVFAGPRAVESPGETAQLDV